MGTLTAGILSLGMFFLFYSGFYPVNGSRILQLTHKVKLLLRTKSLDEILSRNSFPSVVYFNNAEVGDKRDGIDYVSPVLVALTRLPRLVDIFHINCKRSINKNDCTNYDYKEPGLRVFPNQFKRLEMKGINKNGLEIQKKSTSEMLGAILNALVRMELELPGQPNFKPILRTDTIASLFRKAGNKKITHLVLVGQSKREDTLGRNTILFLLSKEQVLVRIVDNATFFGNFGIKFKEKDKMLAIISWSRRITQLYPKKANGKEFARVVIKFLNERT